MLTAHKSLKISAYRAELEAILVSNIQLVRGLAVAMAAEPNLNQARFSAKSQHHYLKPHLN